ncbi:caspase family protein [Actinosynnema mirum]|uniref:Peptidase C14 caspase catalytic subunit p20 n=1 Tax=Actinosynnema mirum (strain ATCC 29888 / DSM 43827 / JCM 3225 / NBRC 14064 / NCIMB 13271 / NRRL B-12336 / IMRU 3971 / 101) TaxID=446462 RepID=C6WF28_ACTMD|nr:caspase family protein [Actinosynnema mirum]ACU34160.1 peptidase C14 caspase catalytic subunit p20 [Actinosynnema mirum DSM 43827]
MKRALLVGIDRYKNFQPLAGCVNDANAVKPLLARNEDNSLNFHCKLLLDAVERDQLLEEVDALLGGGADFALLYFAGHGAGVGDDLTLVTTNGTPQSPGVRFADVLERIGRSPVREVVVILDCCFSGNAGNVPVLGAGSAYLREGLSILTASRGDQTSAEARGRGVFSTYLEGALDGGASDVMGHVTVAGLYAYLSELFGAWDQRPTFKANVDRLQDLRACKSAVPLDTLRSLADWFPTAEAEFPLDPSYEPDAEPENLEHEDVFKQLQVCRANKLVEPIDTDHMYYAAMNSTGCRLTPLGKRYWQLAERENI